MRIEYVLLHGAIVLSRRLTCTALAHLLVVPEFRNHLLKIFPNLPFVLPTQLLPKKIFTEYQITDNVQFFRFCAFGVKCRLCCGREGARKAKRVPLSFFGGRPRFFRFSPCPVIMTSWATGILICRHSIQLRTYRLLKNIFIPLLELESYRRSRHLVCTSRWY